MLDGKWVRPFTVAALHCSTLVRMANSNNLYQKSYLMHQLSSDYWYRPPYIQDASPGTALISPPGSTLFALTTEGRVLSVSLNAASEQSG